MTKSVPSSRRAKTRAGMIVRTIALEPELHRRLSIASLDRRITVNELLRRILRDWLAQERRKS